MVAKTATSGSSFFFEGSPIPTSSPGSLSFSSSSTSRPASSAASIRIPTILRRESVDGTPSDVQKDALVTLSLSSLSFLDTIVRDGTSGASLYAVKTSGNLTTVVRRDATGTTIKTTEIRWPGSSKTKDEVQIIMRGARWKGADHLLKNNSNPSNSRKFTIPNLSQTLKWKRSDNTFMCTAQRLDGPVAMLEHFDDSQLPTLTIYESLYDKNELGIPQLHANVSILLIDYLLISCLLLVTDVHEWKFVKKIRGSEQLSSRQTISRHSNHSHSSDTYSIRPISDSDQRSIAFSLMTRNGMGFNQSTDQLSQMSRVLSPDDSSQSDASVSEYDRASTPSSSYCPPNPTYSNRDVEQLPSTFLSPLRVPIFGSESERLPPVPETIISSSSTPIRVLPPPPSTPTPSELHTILSRASSSSSRPSEMSFNSSPGLSEQPSSRNRGRSTSSRPLPRLPPVSRSATHHEQTLPPWASHPSQTLPVAPYQHNTNEPHQSRLVLKTSDETLNQWMETLPPGATPAEVRAHFQMQPPSYDSIDFASPSVEVQPPALLYITET